MNEIISKMMRRIQEEIEMNEEYLDSVSRLQVSEGKTETWHDAYVLYHRSCASVIAMKDMFKLVTGIPYETAVERMGKGA